VQYQNPHLKKLVNIDEKQKKAKEKKEKEQAMRPWVCLA